MSHTLPPSIAHARSHKPPRGPVTLCGQDVPASCHICAFFDSREQQYDVLLPYFREGLEHREQVVSIFDAHTSPDHVERLARSGLAVDDGRASRQLRLTTAEETFLPDGRFEAGRMYGVIEDMLRSAAQGDFPHVRTCGEMTWVLRHLEATDPLIEYEARLNSLVDHHECTLMCVYDVNLFSGPVLMDVLATHPYVLMGQSLTQNPYYVPPMQYLRRLMQRRGAPAARREPLPA